MSGSQFNIPAAVRNAYAFVWRERSTLAVRGLLPVGVMLLTDLMLYKPGRDIAIDELPAWNVPFELFVWSLPANLLFGGFMFEEVRLLLLGERAGRHLPPEPEYRAARTQALQGCVILWLLFNMAQTGFGGIVYWAVDQIHKNPSSPAGMLVFLTLGFAVWAIRFGVVYILAAVGYPIRPFLLRVNGLGISLRLVGMSVLCIIPVFLCMAGLHTLLVPENGPANGPATAPVPETTARVLMTVNSLLNSFSQVLLTAASAFALREILGPRRERAA
jgi:hypothetical protein